MKKGFTLADVLITLGVIGIVAAMTLPVLIGHWQEKITVSKLKKLYSVLNQAYTRAVEDNGGPESWDLKGLNSFEGAKNIHNNMAPFLSVLQNCGQEKGCFYDGYYKTKSGSNWSKIEQPGFLGMYKFVLQDGTALYIQTRSADCTEGKDSGLSLAAKNICAFIVADINGAAKPNVWAKDLFAFQLTKYGIIPRGGWYNDNDAASSFYSGCLNSKSTGWACAAWVIFNENMDYLRCDDLSWNGKTKCK